MTTHIEKIFRAQIQDEICSRLLSLDENGIPSNADKTKESSIAIAQLILLRMDYYERTFRRSDQVKSFSFEQIIFNATEQFLGGNFGKNQHFWLLKSLVDSDLPKNLRPLSRVKEIISEYENQSTAQANLLLPDILIFKIKDHLSHIIDFDNCSTIDFNDFILNASISCIWTLQPTHEQTSYSEVITTIRNRKGHLPHIVAVTAEPLPTRIASLALGTGDLDCVYHFALDELVEATREVDNEGQMDMLQILIEGRRLRDISDLPFDLIM